MKITQKSQVIVTTSHHWSLRWPGEPGRGFGFECDSTGRILDPKCPEAVENIRKIAMGEYVVEDHGVETFTNSYREPAWGKCDDCGAEVSLGHFTNTCDCGADYNSAGQRLAPRDQWGEETGECAVDLLREDF